MEELKETRQLDKEGDITVTYNIERSVSGIFVKGFISINNKIIGNVNSDTKCGNLSISIDRDRDVVGVKVSGLFASIIDDINNFVNQ